MRLPWVISFVPLSQTPYMACVSVVVMSAEFRYCPVPKMTSVFGALDADVDSALLRTMTGTLVICWLAGAVNSGFGVVPCLYATCQLLVLVPDRSNAHISPNRSPA